MLPSVVQGLTTDSAVRVFPGVWKLLSFLRLNSAPTSFVSLFIFYIFFYLLSKTMGCFSGCLMSSASIQKLFCEIYSAFKCSFDEFMGEKVVSPSYSSAILAPAPSNEFLKAETTEATVGRLLRDLDGRCSLTTSSYSSTETFQWFVVAGALIRGFPARTLSRIRSPYNSQLMVFLRIQNIWLNPQPVVTAWLHFTLGPF